MPDIQTALSTALKGTKLTRKPLMERVWLWVKDHPGVTSSEAFKALKETESCVSSMLTQLYYRKMVTRRSDFVFHGSNRKAYRYTVEPGMRGEYELLPVQKVVLQPAQPVQPIVQAVPLPPTITTALPEVCTDLEAVQRAYNTWRTLDAFFNPQNRNS